MPEEVDPTVRELVSPGEEISATDVFKGVHELTEQRVIAEQIWERVDILLTPAAPSHPRFEDVAAAPIEANAQLGAYTTFVNLLGWCALVTPCKTGHVPFGVQWIARAGHDVALLALGCGIPILPGAIAPKNAALGGADAMPHKEPISERVMRLAVVGAHLAGMPLHHEMQRARAKLVSATSTSPHYRLFALRGTVPPKPGLVRVAWRGHAILIEVYDVPVTEVGHFLDGIPHPLGLGTVETADGEWVTGFIAEPCALHGATDVTRFGGWRAFIAAGSLQWSLLYTATVATGVSGALALSAWVNVPAMRKDPSIILRGHGSPVSSVHFLQGSDGNSQQLLSGDESGTLYLWDLFTEEGICVHTGKSAVISIAERDGTLYVQHKSGTLCAGDTDALHTREALHAVELPPAPPSASLCRIALHSVHELLYPDADASKALLIDTRAPSDTAPSFKRPDTNGMLTALCSTRDEINFIAAYEDGSVARWDKRQPRTPSSALRVCVVLLSHVIVGVLLRLQKIRLLRCGMCSRSEDDVLVLPPTGALQRDASLVFLSRMAVCLALASNAIELMFKNRRYR
eukprot:IDg12400t1